MSLRRWIIGAGILLLSLGVACWVVDRAAYQPFSRRTTFTEIAPPAPLMYLQISRLHERVAHLRRSADYQTFLHSDAVAQLQQTLWWPAFRENFEVLWRSLIIDPMRIIGSEAALAVYETPEGELLPAAILIGRVDRVARIAERVLYGYDRMAHQVGMAFFQTYQRIAIYKIEQPDLICPLYYALTGDMGMIATSLPLLHDTLDRLLKRIEPPVAANAQDAPFATLIGTIQADRFVTGYIELDRLINEFHQNPLFSMYGWFQDAAWRQSATFPQIAYRVETSPDQITIRTDWFTEDPLPVASEPVTNTSAPKTDVPIVIARYQEAFTHFMNTWQQWFPGWQWDVGSLLPEQVQTMYGEVAECQLAEQLAGTGLPYPLPDVSCIVDTRDAAASERLLETLVQQTTAQLPALLRQSVKVVNTPYQETNLTRIQFLIQELFSYAVLNNPASQAGPAGYTLFSTNGKNVQHVLDRLRAQPETPPFTFNPSPSQTAALAVIQPDRLANLLQAAMQTNTIKLAVPPQRNEAFYRIAPVVIQALAPLPPVSAEAGLTGPGLYLEMRMYPRR